MPVPFVSGLGGGVPCVEAVADVLGEYPVGCVAFVFEAVFVDEGFEFFGEHY